MNTELVISDAAEHLAQKTMEVLLQESSNLTLDWEFFYKLVDFYAEHLQLRLV